MRSIHLYFNEDTYKTVPRQELLDRVKSVLTLAQIEYSILGAKGFNETSNYLDSYVKVVMKDENPKEEEEESWMKAHFAKLRQISDELIKVQGLYVLDNMKGAR